jgi:hypothetical protein
MLLGSDPAAGLPSAEDQELLVVLVLRAASWLSFMLIAESVLLVALPLLDSPLLLPLLLMLVVDSTWHRLGMPSTVLLGALPSAASSACAALTPARWGHLLSCIGAAGTGRSGATVMLLAALPADGTAAGVGGLAWTSEHTK